MSIVCRTSSAIALMAISLNFSTKLGKNDAYMYLFNNRVLSPYVYILKPESNFTLLLYIPFLGICEWYFECV